MFKFFLFFGLFALMQNVNSLTVYNSCPDVRTMPDFDLVKVVIMLHISC